MSSMEETKSTETTPLNDNIASLLDFQHKFLSLVHSHLYSQKEPIDDALVKFQITHLSDANNSWKAMVDDLTFSLIKQRTPYDNQLRDYFHKIINADFLPLIRINRHELTHLSLYGFDIYVDPLSALLEIINRIDGLKSVLSQRPPCPQEAPLFDRPADVWESVKAGWVDYMFQAALYKISLNIYILKEYLKIGAKSLVKKDKEIVFTGCGNLFSQFVPILKASKQLWLLVEFSTLANELYNFHPSFNYSHFFSLMLPLKVEYEPVFRSISVIGDKCLHTNILTPLLFAVLRHRKSFIEFIEQANDECWADYLNAIAYGLILNFKARILEYEESLDLLKRTITKLGVMGRLDITYFSGELKPEWSEAREFFISALKVGYNVGQLQTWHPTDHNLIQPKIMEYTLSAILMQDSTPDPETLGFYLQKNEGQCPQKMVLERSLLRISGNRLNYSQFTENGFNKKIVEDIQNEITKSEEKETPSQDQPENTTQSRAPIKSTAGVSLSAAQEEMLKLPNLLAINQLTQSTCALSYTLAILSGLISRSSDDMQSKLKRVSQKVLAQCMANLQNHRNEDLSEILFEYCLALKPQEIYAQLFQLYLGVLPPRQALSQILRLAKENPETARWIACNVIGLYNSRELKNPITLKSFNKEYKVDSDVINLRNRVHTSVSFLIEKIIRDKSQFAMAVLLEIPKACQWTAIPILSFPATFTYDGNTSNNKLESFSLWFIREVEHHEDLLELMRLSLESEEKEMVSYCRQISSPNVCEQIISEVNRVGEALENIDDHDQYEYLIRLMMLLQKALAFIEKEEEGSRPLSILSKNMVKLYLKCIEKMDKNREKSIMLLIESLSTLYPALISQLYESPLSGYEWRVYMRKICLISLDVTSTSILLPKETLSLPSIKNDNSFLIQNSIDYFKEEDAQTIELDETTKASINALYHRAKPLKLEEEEEEEEFGPVRGSEIYEFKLDENTDAYLMKEFLLPSLPAEVLSEVLSLSSSKRFLMADLLAMTPSNHHRLSKWCLESKDVELLIYLGLSKQMMASNLPSIIHLLSNEQMKVLISCLDSQSLRSLSDSFCVEQLVGEEGRVEVENAEILKFMQCFSGSLGFLMVYNHSCWRYLMEWASKFGNKISMNIPSVILQYLEYHRITANVSKDYEDKIEHYSKFLSILTSLLQQKYQYLKELCQMQSKNKSEDALLSQQSSVSGSIISGISPSMLSSVTPKIRSHAEFISDEEIQLFQNNELGNIKLLCETWSLRDVLSRAASFQKETGILSNPSPKYEPVSSILNSIVDNCKTINHLSNQMAGGQIVSPNFTHNFRLCSKPALYDYKITIGQSLEEYFQEIGSKEVDYIYRPPISISIPLNEYIENYINSVECPPPHLAVIIDSRDKALAKEKYQEIRKQLMEAGRICVAENGELGPVLKSLPAEEEREEGGEVSCITVACSEKEKNVILHFGCLYEGLARMGEGEKLSNLLQAGRKREKIPWELLKVEFPEIYHYIKAILIDDEISARKLTFTFREKPLVPDGDTLNVNIVNRLRYCNLVGEACLKGAVDLIEQFSMGCSVIE